MPAIHLQYNCTHFACNTIDVNCNRHLHEITRISTCIFVSWKECNFLITHHQALGQELLMANAREKLCPCQDQIPTAVGECQYKWPKAIGKCQDLQTSLSRSGRPKIPCHSGYEIPCDRKYVWGHQLGYGSKCLSKWWKNQTMDKLKIKNLSRLWNELNACKNRFLWLAQINITMSHFFPLPTWGFPFVARIGTGLFEKSKWQSLPLINMPVGSPTPAPSKKHDHLNMHAGTWMCSGAHGPPLRTLASLPRSCW